VIDPEIVDRLLHFSAEDAPVLSVYLEQHVVAASLRFPVPDPSA
jgi:hypothetical protein